MLWARPSTATAYAAVVIGDQCWFAENLRTTVYADGYGSIPEVTGYSGMGTELSTGARCDFENDAANEGTHTAGMYNWYAVDECQRGCAQAAGTSRRMESGRTWKTTSRLKDLQRD